MKRRLTPGLVVSIFMAEDFTLKGNVINFISRVKSSRMIHSPLS